MIALLNMLYVALPDWKVLDTILVSNNYVEAEIVRGTKSVRARFSLCLEKSAARKAASVKECLGIDLDQDADLDRNIGPLSNQILFGKDFFKKYNVEIDPTTFRLKVSLNSSRVPNGYKRYTEEPEFSTLFWRGSYESDEAEYRIKVNELSPISFMYTGPEVQLDAAGVSNLGDCSVLFTESGVYYKLNSKTDKLTRLACLLSFRSGLPFFVKGNNLLMSTSWLLGVRQKASTVLKLDSERISDKTEELFALTCETISINEDGNEKIIDLSDFGQ
jgi:hypothetical protein